MLPGVDRPSSLRFCGRRSCSAESGGEGPRAPRPFRRGVCHRRWQSRGGAEQEIEGQQRLCGSRWGLCQNRRHKLERADGGLLEVRSAAETACRRDRPPCRCRTASIVVQVLVAGDERLVIVGRVEESLRLVVVKRAIIVVGQRDGRIQITQRRTSPDRRRSGRR